MKKKIIIFGDSYGDPEYFTSQNKFNDTITWHELLKSNYIVINHSVSGSGPHYSFKKYYEFISKKQRTKDYICVFLLSGQDRINFPGKHPSSGTHIGWDNKNKKSYLINEKDKSFYDDFKSEIDFFYLTMQEEIDWFNYKNISFLFVNSILLGLKTIIFLTSCSYDIRGAVLDFEKMNNSNFFISPTVLSDVSEMEFNDMKKNKSYSHFAFTDFRRNHFSQENHEIFYKNIEKIINNDYILYDFKKHLNPLNYYGTISHNDSIDDNKFIYD